MENLACLVLAVEYILSLNIYNDNCIFTVDSIPFSLRKLKLQINKTIRTRSIDLHGYSLDGANKAIENFINKSCSDGRK